MLTTIDPRAGPLGSYDAYEYVVHSHQYSADNIPAARFSYELSPIQARRLRPPGAPASHTGQRHCWLCRLSALLCGAAQATG